MLKEQLNGVDPRKRVKAEENRLSQSKNKSENEQEDVKKEKNTKKRKHHRLSSLSRVQLKIVRVQRWKRAGRKSSRLIRCLAPKKERSREIKKKKNTSSTSQL